MVWGPRMVNPALTSRRGVVQQHAVLLDTEQSFTKIRFDDWHFLLTNWHFLLMGNGRVFTCYSNWPVQVSLSREKLIKIFWIISFCIPRKWRQKNHSDGSRGPSDTAGPGVAYPLTLPPSRRPCAGVTSHLGLCLVSSITFPLFRSRFAVAVLPLLESVSVAVSWTINGIMETTFRISVTMNVKQRLLLFLMLRRRRKYKRRKHRFWIRQTYSCGNLQQTDIWQFCHLFVMHR